MAELVSLHQVKTAMRNVFGAAADIDPMLITDDSNLYDPPPPAGDLSFPPPPAPVMASTLTLACQHLLGTKIAAQFSQFLLPPDIAVFTTFGPLSRAVHRRINEMATRALFFAVCAALARDPNDVRLSDEIKHPDENGALTFANRLSHEIRQRVCQQSTFALTDPQLAEVAEDTTVQQLIDKLTEILSNGGCL